LQFLVRRVENCRCCKMVGNKRAQLGSTVTWMVAFTIIFFVLLLYLIGVGGLAIKGKSFKSGVGSTDFSVVDLEGQRRAVVLLNSEVEFFGENVKLRDAVVESMEVYLEDDVYTKFNIDNLNQLGQVTLLRRREILEQVFVGAKVNEVQEKMIAQENRVMDIFGEELNDECYTYFVDFPLFSRVYFNGKLMGNSYSYYRDIVDDKSLIRSLITFNENGKSFNFELYSGKHIGGSCDEK